MKKAIIAAMLSLATFAYSSVTDTYTVKATMQTPVVMKAGYRDYASHKYTGTLDVVWEDDTSTTIESATMVLTDTKTKVVRTFDVTFQFLNLIGKNYRKPTALFNAKTEDIELQFAGKGTTKVIKVLGCTPCEASYSCRKVNKVAGYITGWLDCECGNDSPTIKATTCIQDGAASACSDGPAYEHDTKAAVWGTFTLLYKTTTESGE